MADVITAPETLTWDIAAVDGGPRRPSLEDLGGATLEDDALYPPDPATMPYAKQLNQWAKQLEAVAAIVPFVAFSVQFFAGVPTIVAFTCPRRTGVLILGTTGVTDLGDGDTSITWPAGTFPPALLKPECTINEDIEELVGATIVSITNGVRVRTYNAAGLVDLAFTVAYR
jgi:hypothetical protein